MSRHAWGDRKTNSPSPAQRTLPRRAKKQIPISRATYSTAARQKANSYQFSLINGELQSHRAIVGWKMYAVASILFDVDKMAVLFALGVRIGARAAAEHHHA